jgi:hypothetical protein
MKLGKDVFLALAQVAWADGEVSAGEAKALVRAAKAAGLAGADLQAVESALASRESSKRAPKVALTAEQSEMVYALACALSAVDGQIAESEREAIASLGDRLKIPFDARGRGAAASVAVAKELEVGGDAIAALTRELSGER